MVAQDIRRIFETAPITDGRIETALSIAMGHLKGTPVAQRRTSPFSIIQLTAGLENEKELRRLWKKLNDTP